MLTPGRPECAHSFTQPHSLLCPPTSTTCSKYDAKRFLDDYVAFLTTPGTHNDTYAESFHR